MSPESGFHWTYMMVSVENNSNETVKVSGHVAKLVFILTKLTLHGKLYTGNGETSTSTTFVAMVPDVVERNDLPPRCSNGCK